MKSKKIKLNIICHILVIIIWSVAYKLNIYSDNQAFINFLSIAIAYLFINEVYIKLISRKNESERFTKTKHLWPILWLSTLILQGQFPWMVLALFIISEVSGLLDIRNKNRDKKIFLYPILLAFAFLSYLLQQKFLAALLLMASILLDSYFSFGYKQVRKLNLLPIAKESVGKFVVLVILVFVLILSILDLETIAINIFFQILMMLFLYLLSLNLESQAGYYEEVKSFYLVSSYLEKERDDFSRLIHDEFIQDLKASQTLLNLKEPDTKKAKEILKDLEKKSRKIMNFYSSNLFDYFSFDENFENMLQSIKTLYPHKDLEIHWRIDPIENKEDQKLIMQISKELINNIYKHSDASYISYTCKSSEDKYFIYCESDGASREDFERIEQSIGGILIIKLAVAKNHGKIEYSYSNGILKTEISLGGEGD